MAIGAFFPVYTTVAAALARVDAHLVEVGRAYGRSGLSLLGTVLFPAALPAVLSGLRLGLAQSWLFLVAAELIASSMGLGFLLIDSQNTGRTDVMLLAILLLALIGKATDSLLGLLELLGRGRGGGRRDDPALHRAVRGVVDGGRAGGGRGGEGDPAAHAGAVGQ
ncbi:ABC transporter permease [Dactylosporangium sp. CS-047395]|uniref:ABC transporter permease n=1 Tax=Dactylosporangium sp. CS-047395 TaxID=3239936 RepID=UPI003D8FFDF7